MPSFLLAYKKYVGISLIAILGIIIVSIFLFKKSDSPIPPPLTVIEAANELENVTSKTNPPQQQTISNSVIVDVKGAVKKPGVYHLQQESRVEQAIAQAGGFTAAANKKIINLAAKLQDEQVIYVLAKGEKPIEMALLPASMDITKNSSSTEQQELVNLNTADETQLQTLSGIGPAKSQAIIAYRTENGPFQSIDDIKKISGFGEKTFERLKPLITVQ